MFNVNQAFVDLCGYARQEVLGQNYFFLAGANTDPEVESRIRAAMRAEEPLNQEVMAERARLLALELAGHNPTPLEVLLSERVASLWVLVELQEMLGAAWYNREIEKRPSPAYMLQMVRLQESAHRRYLAAIKTLAQVQKMRGPARVQVNIGENQVNVS